MYSTISPRTFLKCAKIAASVPSAVQPKEISLYEFLPVTLKVVQPSVEFEGNWHHELICEYLECLLMRMVQEENPVFPMDQPPKLRINIAPRHLKTIICSTAFPAWAWLKHPTLSFLCMSYNQELANSISFNRRSLIMSDAYQEIAGGLSMSDSRNQVKSYRNEYMGQMDALGMVGVAGKGGDCLIFDDPIDPERYASEVDLKAKVDAYQGLSATRKNNPKHGAELLIQQRTHESDISGAVEKEEGWVVLSLPTIATKEETFHFPISGKTYTRYPGDLLHKERFGQKEADEALLKLGAYKFAARHQQEPSPIGGGMFRIEDWCMYVELPTKAQMIISMDAAFKETKTSDFVVIMAIAKEYIGMIKIPDMKPMKRHKYYVPAIWRDRAGMTRSEQALIDFCKSFPKAQTKLIEDKANGPAIINRLNQQIRGLTPYNPGRDGKIARADAITPIHQRGDICLPLEPWAAAEVKAMGKKTITVAEWWELHPPTTQSDARDVPAPQWAKDMIEEHAKFPTGANDDQVDALDQGINWFENNTRARKGDMGRFRI